MTYKIGDKIKFKSEKRRYTIVSNSDRYLICTKPFHLRGNKYIYTIVDLVEKKRGPDFWLFGKYDLTKQEDIDLCLQELESGECQLSRRRTIDLDIEDGI